MKGPSWLSCLKSFNYIEGMSVEYMHCALLGVSKLLWTDVARCGGSLHDVRHAIPTLDKRIKNIVHRPKPRGISDLKHWKGDFVLLVQTNTCT